MVQDFFFKVSFKMFNIFVEFELSSLVLLEDVVFALLGLFKSEDLARFATFSVSFCSSFGGVRKAFLEMEGTPYNVKMLSLFVSEFHSMGGNVLRYVNESRSLPFLAWIHSVCGIVHSSEESRVQVFNGEDFFVVRSFEIDVSEHRQLLQRVLS